MSQKEFSDQLPAWARYLREFGSYGVVIALFVFYILRLEPILNQTNVINERLVQKIEQLDSTLEKLEIKMSLLEAKIQSNK